MAKTPERSKPHRISPTLGGFPSKYLPKAIMGREGKLDRLKNQQLFLIHKRGKDAGKSPLLGLERQTARHRGAALQSRAEQEVTAWEPVVG